MTGLRAVPKACLVLAAISFSFFMIYRGAAQAGENELDEVRAALQNREYEKALDLLRPLLEASSSNPQLWTLQGKAYAGGGQSKQALISFYKALSIAPDYVPALQGEAQIKFDAGSPAAIPVLEHLLRLRRDDKTSHGMLAVLEYRQGNCARAVVHFEKAGDLFDSQVEALHADAVCLVKLKQVAKGAQVFERVVAMEPANLKERQLL